MGLAVPKLTANSVSLMSRSSTSLNLLLRQEIIDFLWNLLAMASNLLARRHMYQVGSGFPCSWCKREDLSEALRGMSKSCKTWHGNDILGEGRPPEISDDFGCSASNKDAQ